MAKELDIVKYRKLLLAERDRLDLERRARLLDLSDLGSELANYDQHPGDQGTETYERTKEFALDENFKGLIEQIDEALRKIDDGSYGRCDRCDAPINPDRLRAIPYATLCINCQEAIERR
ncbi:MAG: TraR/DksA C4-type zinc finger protein [Armatimonadetes bacterium]|nr:TraR/DksA C4-type zinc finger protein [Armatimonadota bacterium]